MKLYDWQVPYVEHLRSILGKRDSALLVVPPGGGKTYMAAEVMRQRATRRNLHLVLCPKSIIPAWNRVLDSFGLSGEFMVLNYEQLTGHSKYAASGELGEWRCVSTKQKKSGKLERIWNWFWNEDFAAEAAVVFDEAHRCNGRDSRAEALLLASCRQMVPHLMMTATPPDNPLNMRGLGSSLNIFPKERFWDWAISHGVRKSYVHSGFEFPMHTPRQREEAEDHLRLIHDIIFPASGVVMSHEELRKFYPQGHVYLEEVEVTNSEKFEVKYAAEFRHLADLVEKCEIRLLEELRLHQELEFAKVEVFKDQAQDLIAAGNSVACFVNFRQTANTLAKELKCELIIGEQNAVARQKIIDDFQSNAINCLVLTTAAGSEAISLHDLHGGHPRVSLLSPIWNPVTLKQALGRIHRAGGQSLVTQKVLVSSGLEEKIYRRCLQRLRNMGALTGDEGFNLEKS